MRSLQLWAMNQSWSSLEAFPQCSILYHNVKTWKITLARIGNVMYTSYTHSGHQLKWCMTFVPIIGTSKHLWLLQSKVTYPWCTLRRLYFATAEVRFMFSSSCRKLGLAFNHEYLCQFFINFNNQCQFWNPHDEQITNLSLIFKINEEITEKIGNEKDETKLIFEKYQLSLTSNISAKISSNWACRGFFGIVTTSRF